MLFTPWLLAGLLIPETLPPEFQQPHRVFAELNQLCRQDAGALWGASLCGPVLIADFEQQRLFANQPDPQGRLQSSHELYVSKHQPDE